MHKQINTSKDIWVYPASGVTPDVSLLLAVQSIQQVFDASAALRDQHLSGTEAFASSQTEDLKAMQKDLAAKGVDFDVERLLRGSLWDRLADRWYDFLDWFRPGDTSLDADFSFEIVLGMTHPTQTLPFAYDVIFAENQRLKSAVADAITKARGHAPDHLHVQLDEPEDDDAWTDDDMFRAEMADFDMLWPSIGDLPGFALAERQADGGLPIEIVLLVCAPSTFDRIVALQ